MTAIKKILRPNRNLPLILMFIFGMASLSNGSIPETNNERAASAGDQSKSIKIGLLLDTSNSMDGLIDQAKSQLWNIVNELAAAKCDEGQPSIQIALYEYGNDRLNAREGYIRLVTPLTDDLDQISEDLFQLTTQGGSEFCGHVIQTSLDQLNWAENKEDLKLIFIAGNEPFTQGDINYRKSCNLAAEKGITINTIFCGPFDEGISTKWKDGADIANGHYMSIEQNRKTVYIPSPYDDQIDALNSRLNDTYIYYGRKGASYKEKQTTQDSNAESISYENKVARAVSKGSHAYKNSKWDLVDASIEEDFDIDKVDNAYLPKEMQDMTDGEKLKYIEKAKAERKAIQKEIQTLNTKRTAFINKKKKEMGTDDNMLDVAMIKAIKEQAKFKDFKFE